ncbi:MAG: OPT/YSL family transporter, partial [Betaproteobacteria bacterium]|nr:OPT/YSL family transporter [Betaproteobacteria bacterium]
KQSGAGDENAGRAKLIFGGFLAGLIYKTANVALKGWKDVPEKTFGAPLKGGSVGIEISPELLGVGYIIGPRIAATMCAGGVMAYLLLIPLIKFFGDALGAPLAPGTKLISEMSPNDIRSAYVLYIGAGAVAAGGIVCVVRALPMIWMSLKSSLSAMRGTATDASSLRTENDIPMKWVLIGSIAIMAVIVMATPLHMNLLGAALIVVFGFLFSTVSSQLTGQIGSSSNPISGMTVATLLFTCLVFLLVGWTGGPYYVTALSVGAIVCIASSNAGTTSQDLKTGHLVGGTPRFQQYAILAGALASALMLGPILLKLNDASTVYVPAAQVAPGLKTDASKLTERESLNGPQAESDTKTYRVWHKSGAQDGPPGKYLVDEAGNANYLVDPGINGAHNKRPDGTEVRKYDAPKAVLMSYIIKGILDRELPWALVMFGVMIALTMELAGVASLPFAVGVYLPLSSSMPILVGGLVRGWVDRKRNQTAALKDASEDERNAAGDRSAGVLLSSGYIAGGALAGILIAFSAGVLTDFDKAVGDWAAANNPFFDGPWADALSLLPYVLLIWFILRASRNEARG